MSYPRIVNAVFHAPWAIHRPWLGSMFSLLHSRMGEPVNAETFGAERAETTARLRHGSGSAKFSASRWGKHAGALVNHSARIHADAIKKCEGSYAAYEEITQEKESALPDGQILHVFGSGIIGKHLSSMEELCAGGLSVDRIQSAIKTARTDDKIGAVVLHLDTPGGMCYGCPETAAMVDALRSSKHVVSFGDSLTASAGYWLTARADHYYITPSAEVGSIGVYCAYTDYTEYCKKQGIAVTLIADGKHKGAGLPGTSLTEEQLALIEHEVKAMGSMFRTDVTAGRSEGVTLDTMQGQCFTGKDAVQARLADVVVNDIDDCLADVARAI